MSQERDRARTEVERIKARANADAAAEDGGRIVHRATDLLGRRVGARCLGGVRGDQ